MDERLDGRQHPQRIAIVGVSGAGKSRLARQLAGRHGLRHIELDRLHWRARHSPPGSRRFAGLVGEALARDRWICDGNYLGLWESIAARAELVVWLDPPAWRVVVRQLRRAVCDRSDREPWRLGLRALVLSPWRAHRVAPRRIRKTRAALTPAMATTHHLLRVRSSRQLRRLIAALSDHDLDTPTTIARCASAGAQTP